MDSTDFVKADSRNLPVVDPFMIATYRRGSRISARGGRHGIDDLIWDGDERFLAYANTNLQLFKMFIAILCLNDVEQPFKRHQCPFFLLLRRRNPRLRRGSLRPRGGRPPQRPPPLDPRLTYFNALHGGSLEVRGVKAGLAHAG